MSRHHHAKRLTIQAHSPANATARNDVRPAYESYALGGCLYQKRTLDLSRIIPPRNVLAPLILVVAALVVAGCQLPAAARGADAAPIYVALGASDAVGVGANNPALESWPALVHAGLPVNTQFINLGISGATLGDVIRDELPPALDARPNLITLWSGVNDLRAGVTLPTFAAQLDQLLGRLVQSGANRPTLVVLNLPDLRKLPAFTGVDPALLDATVRRWNAAIAAAAQRRGALLVDLYTRGPDLAAHPEYISADGFHPSSAGYRRIADLVLATVKDYASSNPPKS